MSPTELESVLRLHPDVLDAAVVGIKDDVAGDLPRALVVPRSPHVRLQDVVRFFNGTMRFDFRFYVPLDTKQVISETFFPGSLLASTEETKRNTANANMIRPERRCTVT